ncbi:signal peptide peptidase SppA [Desulfoferrobacter suflitae]|uniref:signal peptide peptidase SppA n=1 Tax=Desulfoferrobacter suflitae TaxID=2865782 RepID=UPI002164A0D2|nr:signal peptide peptidase SppA [Desulfoferrobacter suflitae]MCK8602761.1 signal peptide peptidase SppA [Desulfoferrobacter suflitae]
MIIYKFAIITLTMLSIAACSPKINIFPDTTKPLKEKILQGSGKDKVLLVHIRGFISDTPGTSLFQPKPSMLQEIVAQFRLAQKDDHIKAVVLQINTPGGSTTASDILYQEIVRFKRKSNVKVVAAMMDVAASGGYYICLPCDYIIAHPTTVTGSVGVLFITPKVIGLMAKIGLEVEISKSGENKDMGSPFRAATEAENQIVQGLIDELGQRFIDLVGKHRKHVSQDELARIATGRIYLANQALKVGLVDEIAYMDDAVSRARELAGLPEDAKVVSYRRTEYPDDNLYNTATSEHRDQKASLIDTGFLNIFSSLPSGFYYLWLPANQQ